MTTAVAFCRLHCVVTSLVLLVGAHTIVLRLPSVKRPRSVRPLSNETATLRLCAKTAPCALCHCSHSPAALQETDSCALGRRVLTLSAVGAGPTTAQPACS